MKNEEDKWHPALVVYTHGELKAYNFATILESDRIKTQGREWQQDKDKKDKVLTDVAVSASLSKTPDVKKIEILLIINGL